MSETQIPRVLLRNLDLYTGQPDADTTLVAVLGNKTTVRVAWTDAMSKYMVFATAPTSATAAGSDGSVAIDDSLYSYAKGKWGKTARYTANWDDITSTTRFLFVDRHMPLSEVERTNVRETIGLGLATNTTTGVVKGSASVVIGTTGEMTVPTASEATAGITLKQGEGPAASTTYVKELINAIPVPGLAPATETTLGGIMSSSSVVVGVNGTATVPIAVPGDQKAGLVRLALLDTYTEAQAAYAAPVALVSKIFDNKIKGVVSPATATTAGVIIPTGALFLQDTKTGAVAVKTSDTTTFGIVKTVDAIPEVIPADTGLVPSLKAVKSYVDAGTGGIITPESLPYATSAKRGAIISSATVRVNESGTNVGQAYVPPATANTAGVVTTTTIAGDSQPNKVPSTFYMTDSINKATSGIKQAAVTEARSTRPSAIEHGMVRVNDSTSDTVDSRSIVPSSQYMRDYVTNATASVTWTGGAVANLATFNGGVKTVTVNTPVDADVLNYGQLKTLLPGGGGGSWNGGTVANASTFNGGLSTPNVAGTPAPAQVLNYGQLKTLLPGGGGSWDGGTVNNPTTFNHLVQFRSSAGFSSSVSAENNPSPTDVSVLNYGQLKTLLPGGGGGSWDGGTVNKQAIFNGGISVSAIATFSSIYTEYYSTPVDSHVLNYGQLKTLIGGGGGSWNGGTVANASTFNGGLSTPDYSAPTNTNILNYGQLKTLLPGGGGSVPQATDTQFGTVKLSTLVIGQQDGGRIGIYTAGTCTDCIAAEPADYIGTTSYSDKAGVVRLSEVYSSTQGGYNLLEYSPIGSRKNIATILRHDGRIYTHIPDATPNTCELLAFSSVGYGVAYIRNMRDYSSSTGYTQNPATGLYKFWVGTKAQFDALTMKDPNTIYHNLP